MVALVLNPASGSIEHGVDAVNLSVTGLPANDAGAYDPDIYPTEPAIVYYFSVEKAGQDSLVSPLFSPSEAGKAAWYGFIVPAAGTWTAYVRDASDDTSAGNTTCVVS